VAPGPGRDEEFKDSLLSRYQLPPSAAAELLAILNEACALWNLLWETWTDEAWYPEPGI